MKNHFSIVNFKNLDKNKLRKYIDNIKYNCSKNKPISLKSLLYLIPEVFNEKIDSDNKLALEGKPRYQFDDFFQKFMEQKFRMKKLVNKHIEETILAIIQYSSKIAIISEEDQKVDLFGKFLGIGEKKIRREILDLYLLILKCIYVLNQPYQSHSINFMTVRTVISQCKLISVLKFISRSFFITTL